MPAAPGDCPTEDLLLEFVGGQARTETAERVVRHLAECNACSALVAEIAQDASGPRPPSDPGDADVDEGSVLEAGDNVGRYVILEPIGAGGMGTVYAARDPSLDRNVALKLLKRGTGGPELETRLLREAKAMARLSHPEVVTVYDTGWHGKQLFIAMELLRGGNLRQWLSSAARPWRDVLEMYLRAGRGLARAHAAGIVHRDFKPDNVLVDDEGRVRVTDFGLARAVQSVERAGPGDGEGESDGDSEREEDLGAATTLHASLTRTGVAVGTPAYMAPEQLDGSPADVRSDVFSFCVALYEGLYGDKPFRGDTLKQLHRAKVAGDVTTPPPRRDPPPERLRRAVRVGLRAAPADRYASMDEVLVALERAARSSRRRLVAGVAVAGVVAAIAVPVGRSTWRRAPSAGAGTASVAVPPPPVECTTNRACLDAHGGEPWICRASDHRCAQLASQDCTPKYEEGDLEADDTVWLGAMLPTKGPKADEFWTTGMRTLDLARHEIAVALHGVNAAGSGVRARPVALVACDDSEDPMRAAHHLVDDVGVPAVLGLGSGAEAVQVAGTLLLKRGVLAIATVTANPLVTRLPEPPGPRLAWRTTYSSDQVATATAQIVHDVLEPRTAGRHATTRVVLARNDDPVGASFGEVFFRSLTFNGKRAVDNGSAYHEVAFPPRTPSADELLADADEIIASDPTFVVLAGTPAATVPIVTSVESRWRGAARPTYVVSPGSTAQFAPFVGASADRRQRLFATQSLSNSMANARFVLRYNQAYPDAPVSRQINQSADYDAFYLLAYATFSLGDRPATGSSLSTAFERLLPPGDPIEVGPSDAISAFTRLGADRRIDLVGAQSALDFDIGTGETPSDFVLLCAAVDRNGRASGEDIESGVVYRAAKRAVDGTARCP